MLKDLTKDDWLSILNIPVDRIPKALVLRGTRNLKTQYQLHRRYFTNIMEIGTPNSVLEDVFIGDLSGFPIAYASVYGAPMASEVVHVFGVLGTRLVIQTGCCGALSEEMVAGDLVISTVAFCGEGASQYYQPGEKTVSASFDFQARIPVESVKKLKLHSGRIYTTSALFAEGMEDVNNWFTEGFSAVDMETAATFAVARYFGMDCASLLYVFDNPRQKEHILLGDAEKDRLRNKGNQQMIEAVLDVLATYLPGRT